MPQAGEQLVDIMRLVDTQTPVEHVRPAPLFEVLPQVGAQRHTVDQIVDAVPGLPRLDVPVPRTVEQLVDVLQLFDALTPVAEQVIDVPKIFMERIPPRTSVREAADSGTVGGSAHRYVFFFAPAVDCGADY